MDKFAENLAAGIRRFAMAGIGAVSLTMDKSKEIISRLAEQGEITASESQVACDELQKKLTEQLSAFTQKLKTDYENASFTRILEACGKLTPEQKEMLIQHLTAPSADAEPSPEGCDTASPDADAPVPDSDPGEATPTPDAEPSPEGCDTASPDADCAVSDGVNNACPDSDAPAANDANTTNDLPTP